MNDNRNTKDSSWFYEDLNPILKNSYLNVLIADYRIGNLVLIRSDVCVPKSTRVNLSIH